jgi:hypothetical protein
MNLKNEKNNVKNQILSRNVVFLFDILKIKAFELEQINPNF